MARKGREQVTYPLGGRSVWKDEEYFRDDSLIWRITRSDAKRVYLQGLRRTGKTSFLKRMQHVIVREQSQAQFAAYLSFQLDSAGAIKKDLIRTIRIGLGIDKEKSQAGENLDWWLSQVLKRHDQFLLLIDECFSMLGERERKERKKLELFLELFRISYESEGALRIIFSDTPRFLEELSSYRQTYGDAIDRVIAAKMLRLPSLDRGQAERLLTEGYEKYYGQPITQGDSRELVSELLRRVSLIPLEVEMIGDYYHEHQSDWQAASGEFTDMVVADYENQVYEQIFLENHLSREQSTLLEAIAYADSKDRQRVQKSELKDRGKQIFIAMKDFGILQTAAEGDAIEEAPDVITFTSEPLEVYLRTRRRDPWEENMYGFDLFTTQKEERGFLMSVRIHHISDMRFGRFMEGYSYDDPENLEGTPAGRYLDWLRRINPEMRPHFVVMTGNMTSSGHDKEYYSLERFIDSLKTYVQEIPGSQIGDNKRPFWSQILLVPGILDHDLTSWSNDCHNGVEREPDAPEQLGRLKSLVSNKGLTGIFTERLHFFHGAGVAFLLLDSTGLLGNLDVEDLGDEEREEAERLREPLLSALYDNNRRVAELSRPGVEQEEQTEPVCKAKLWDIQRNSTGYLSKVVLDELTGLYEDEIIPRLEKRRASNYPEDMLRIAVCQHNINPISVSNTSANVEFLLPQRAKRLLIENGFHILMHGNSPYFAVAAEEADIKTDLLGGDHHIYNTFSSGALSSSDCFEESRKPSLGLFTVNLNADEPLTAEYHLKQTRYYYNDKKSLEEKRSIFSASGSISIVEDERILEA